MFKDWKFTYEICADHDFMGRYQWEDAWLYNYFIRPEGVWYWFLVLDSHVGLLLSVSTYNIAARLATDWLAFEWLHKNTQPSQISGRRVVKIPVRAFATLPHGCYVPNASFTIDYGSLYATQQLSMGAHSALISTLSTGRLTWQITSC